MNYQDELDKAGFAVRDKVGKVLSSGAEIIALRERASGYRATKNPEVNATAEAVVTKANGLISNYKAIEGESLALLSQAAELRAKMETDPLWKSILSGNVSMFGWATATQAKDRIGQAMGLVQKLVALASRCDAHLKSVSALRGDVDSLESFAQGKGLRSAITGLRGFAGDYMSMLKWVGVGAVAIAAVVYLPKPRRAS